MAQKYDIVSQGGYTFVDPTAVAKGMPSGSNNVNNMGPRAQTPEQRMSQYWSGAYDQQGNYTGKSDWETTNSYMLEAEKLRDAAKTEAEKTKWSDMAQGFRELGWQDNNARRQSRQQEIDALNKTVSGLDEEFAKQSRSAALPQDVYEASDYMSRDEYLRQRNFFKDRQDQLQAEMDAWEQNSSPELDIIAGLLKDGKLTKEERDAYQARADEINLMMGADRQYYRGRDRVAAVLKNLGLGAREAVDQLGAMVLRGIDYGMGIQNIDPEYREALNYVTDPLQMNDPYLQEAQAAVNSYTKAYNEAGGNNTWAQREAEKLEEVADWCGDTAALNRDRATGGLSPALKFGMNVAFTGAEVAGDVAVAGLSGGSSLVPMAIRVVGQEAANARREGATLGEQAAYGITKGAIEVVSEKLFSAFSKVGYGKGIVSRELSEEVTRKLATTNAGRSLIRGCMSMIEEGAEEGVSDLLGTIADQIYKDETWKESFQNNTKDVWYDMLLGATLGIIGDGAGIVTGEDARANAEARNLDVEEYGRKITDFENGEGPMPTEFEMRAYENSLNGGRNAAKERANEEAKAQGKTAKQIRAEEKAQTKADKAANDRARFEERAGESLLKGAVDVDEQGRVVEGEPESGPVEGSDESLLNGAVEVDERGRVVEAEQKGKHEKGEEKGKHEKPEPGSHGGRQLSEEEEAERALRERGKHEKQSDIIEEEAEAEPEQEKPGEHLAPEREGGRHLAPEKAEETSKPLEGQEDSTVDSDIEKLLYEGKHPEPSKGKHEAESAEEAESLFPKKGEGIVIDGAGDTLSMKGGKVVVNGEPIKTSDSSKWQKYYKLVAKLNSGEEVSESEKLTAEEAKEVNDYLKNNLYDTVDSETLAKITQSETAKATEAEEVEAETTEAESSAEESSPAEKAKPKKAGDQSRPSKKQAREDQKRQSAIDRSVEKGFAVDQRRPDAELRPAKQGAKETRSEEARAETKRVVDKLKDAVSGKVKGRDLTITPELDAVSEKAFPPKKNVLLSEQVATFFKNLGNKVYSKAFGGQPVIIDERGISDDIGHGIGRAKAATFAAVPKILANGTVIDEAKNWKGRGYDTKVIAGRISLAGKPAYVACVVNGYSDSGTKRFYLHEVVDADGNVIYSFDKMPAKAGAAKGSTAPQPKETNKKTPAAVVKTGLAKSDTGKAAEAGNNVPQNKATVKPKKKAPTYQQQQQAKLDSGEITLEEYYADMQSQGIMTSEEASQGLKQSKKNKLAEEAGEQAVDESVWSSILDEAEREAESPEARYERQKAEAEKKIDSAIDKLNSKGQVYFGVREGTRDAEFVEFFSKRYGVDVRVITKAELEQMRNASESNPIYFTKELKDGTIKAIRYNGATLEYVHLQPSPLGVNHVLSSFTIGPDQFGVQARYIAGYKAANYDVSHVDGAGFFSVPGEKPGATETQAEVPQTQAAPASENVQAEPETLAETVKPAQNEAPTTQAIEQSEAAKINEKIDALTEEIRQLRAERKAEQEVPPKEPEPPKKPKVTAQAKTGSSKSAVRDETYKRGDKKQMGRVDYTSMTMEDVSKAADQRIEDSNLVDERDRLLEEDDWDRVDFAEAQHIITQLSIKLNRFITGHPMTQKRPNETKEEYAERSQKMYQQERTYIDDLMKKYMQMKSKAGQELQQKYKTSLADEIRMKAAHRFLAYSDTGWVGKSGTGSHLYKTVDNMLTAVEKAQKGDSVRALADLSKDISYVRGNQSMWGNLGVRGEEAALNFLIKHGASAEDIANFAYANVNKLIDDFGTVKALDAVSTFRILNMLSNTATAINNIINNAAAMRTGALAHMAGQGVARAFEKETGKKVAFSDKSLTRKGNVEAETTAFISAMLMSYYGVNIENGRIEMNNRASFNPNGNFFERLGARYSFLINAAVMNPDAAGKARINSGMQRGIDEAFEGVEMTPEMEANKKELEGYKAGEMNRRLFQADDSVTAWVQHTKNLLNKIQVGNDKIGTLRLGDFLMAFAKVPTNIVEQRIAATPYGALYHLITAAQGFNKAKQMHADAMAGKPGAVEMSAKDMAKYSMNVGRAATTGAMLAVGALAAATGALKDFGRDDDDDELAKYYRELGYDGLTLNLSALFHGGKWRDNDLIVSGDFLEILAAPLAIGALAWESYADGMSLPQAAWYATKRSFTDILDAMADLPGMQAASQLYESYNYGDGDATLDNVWTSVRQYMANSASSYFIPNLFSQAAAGIDNTMRDAYTADNDWQQSYQMIANKIPFLRNSLPAKLDSWGNARTYGDNRLMGFFNKVILPGDIRTFKTNKYAEEIGRLSREGYRGTMLNPPQPKKLEIGDETYKLDKDQQLQYKAAYAEYATQAYEEFMDSDYYKQLDDGQRQAVLKSLRTDAKRRTDQAFLDSIGEDPSVVKMDKWETLPTSEERYQFLTAKQIGEALWDDDAKRVTDYSQMDEYLKTTYKSLSKDQKDILNNSLSHLDDMYDASKRDITSEQWQKAYDIYRDYTSKEGKDRVEGGYKAWENTEMWTKIEKATKANGRQMDWFENNMRLYNNISPDSEKYHNLVDSGWNRDTAHKLTSSMTALKPAAGYSSVSYKQRLTAIAKASYLSDEQKWEAFYEWCPSNYTSVIKNMTRLRSTNTTTYEQALKQLGKWMD